MANSVNRPPSYVVVDIRDLFFQYINDESVPVSERIKVIMELKRSDVIDVWISTDPKPALEVEITCP